MNSCSGMMTVLHPRYSDRYISNTELSKWNALCIPRTLSRVMSKVSVSHFV